MSTTTSNDRISHLPDALLHQILSLLDMKQVVQTSILSKRWKSLWKSVPNIDIHQDLWINRNSDNSEEYDKCKNFVDQVLQHRDDSFHVHKFSLCCVCTNHELVDKWITCAVTRHHVEEFLLERVHLKFSTFLGHVKILSLKSVFLTSKYTCVFDLPVVENFVLYAPRFNVGIAIIINAPCLKHLSVSDYQGVYGSQGIKICAPNLAHLRLKGKSYADYKMGNLNSLETAEIDLRFDHEQVLVMCLGKLLKELRSIKSLTISVRCFQEFPSALKQVPISFCNVKYLKLTTWHPNGPISPMTELLESFPNVETLVLKSAKVSYDLGRDGDGRAQLSFQFRLCHLKTIEIHNIEGCEHELKFLEFLVEHAIVLENISMKSTKILSGDKEIDLINFCKKIQLSVNASLGITICLTVKRETGLTTVFEEFTRSSISPLGKSEHV